MTSFRTSGTGDGGVTAVAWHALEVPDVLDRVGAGTTGLTSEEATHRLERHGPNRLEATDATAAWRVLLRQFRSPLVLFLMVCAAITLVQGHLVDTAAITAAVVLNAAIGFWQERKAETEVRALQSLASPTARVRRDGHVQTIDSAALVPGDLVHLDSGDRVPADLRLIEAVSLRVDESMLTGESLATDKDTDPVAPEAPTGDRTGMAFSGSLVSSGRATGVVVGTGAGTELGAINELVQDTAAAAPLTALIHSMERWIGLIVGISALGVFAAGLALGHDVSLMFRTAVALVVSAIPEALPVVLTVAMSVGVARMARRNAIVRHLPSVETLGSTTVIGSDKTGTLTQNLLTVERLWTTEGEIAVDAATGVGADTGRISAVAESALRAGALTNEAVPTRDDPLRFTGDAVDAAMAAVAVRLGAVTPNERATAPASDIVLTDDDFSTIVHAVEKGRVTFATIRKATFFLLSTAIAALLAVAVNVFTDSPLILLPVQMLWANLVTSGIQVIALAFEPGEGDELEVPPRNLGEGVLDAPMWWRTALSGVWIAVVTLVVYERAIWDGIETDHARSLALTVLVAASFFQVMNARALRRSVFTLNPLANPLLLAATAVAACLQVMVVSWPVLAGPMGLSALSPGEWVLCVAVGATVIAVSEIHKLAVAPAARRRAAAIAAAGVAAPGR